MQIKEMDQWPPRIGWSLESGAADVVSLSTDQVIIERVARELATYIIFTCKMGDRVIYYELQVDDPKRTAKIAKALRANIGMPLKEVETIEIDDPTYEKIAS